MPSPLTTLSDAEVIVPPVVTRTSDAEVIAGPTLVATSDADVELAHINVPSDALVSLANISITSDALVAAVMPPPSPPNPPPAPPSSNPMNFFCDTSIRCPGTDFPVTNVSSEAPDAFSFIAIYFGQVPNDPTIFLTDPPYLGNTPLNPSFTSSGCIGTCVSTVSQEDADLCAQRQQAQCVQDTHLDPQPPNDPIQVFGNSMQSCDFICPDGSHFTFTVPAGSFLAVSQVYADRIAHSYACRQAALNHVCLGSIQTEACMNESYSSIVPVQGNTMAQFPNSNFWELTSGSLPTGLTFNGGFVTAGDDATISGIPTVSGTFTFTIKVTTPSGEFMSKQYTICVIAVSPNSLPDAVLGVPYSQTMTGTPCALQPINWTLVSGNLPNGMFLDNVTGIISGTPTTLGTFNFTIEATTGAP